MEDIKKQGFWRRLFSRIRTSLGWIKTDDEEVGLEEDALEGTTSSNISTSVRITSLEDVIYAIGQDLESLKVSFPNEYASFSDRLRFLETQYQKDFEDSQRELVFAIHPEKNTTLRAKAIQLQKEVSLFVQTRGEAKQLYQELEVAIVKLNKLYNVSIRYAQERNQMLTQAHRALGYISEIYQEWCKCNCSHEESKFIRLVIYGEYMLCKTFLRNSDSMFADAKRDLNMTHESNLSDFFRAFLQDELSDLRDLVNNITDDAFKRSFNQDIGDLLQTLSFAGMDIEILFMQSEFWQRVFQIENAVTEYIYQSNLGNADFEGVKVLECMNISVTFEEIENSPRDEARVSLSALYSQTKDERAWLLFKFLDVVSEEVTFKDLYFLLALFNLIDPLKSTDNQLYRCVENYVSKYNYDAQKIADKKERILRDTHNAQYAVLAYTADSNATAERIENSLKQCRFSFQRDDMAFYMDSRYFGNLKSLFIQ